MSAAQLQDGADWLYRQFYRLDRIVVRTARALLTCGPVAAVLVWRLNLTYRYDNLREHIVGRNPVRRPRRNLLDVAADLLWAVRGWAMRLRSRPA